jgi:hypothetical protein
MKRFVNRHPRVLLGFLVAFSLLLVLGGAALFQTGEVSAKLTHDPEAFYQGPLVFDLDDPQIRAVMAVQNRHTPDLLRLPEVVGTATGVNAAGIPAVLVFTKQKVPPGLIPETMEGRPVVVRITGEIHAMPRPPKPGGDTVDPKARFGRPVPIGVSTGNANECSAGTIGARVKGRGKAVYALSNNHVYARENDADIDEEVLQPGRYDTKCYYDSNNHLGKLTDFEPINFSISADDNVIDAAIALSSTDLLGNATPSNGYGVPKSGTQPAGVGQQVQKYGRTTALTKGAVNAINATINIGYDSGTARFVNQIVVYGKKPVIKAGDSGSLLVTDPGKNPVGLLFAGSSDGKWAIANPIDAVLDRFNVSIDGE